MNRKFIVILMFLLVLSSCGKVDEPDYAEKVETNQNVTGTVYENGQSIIKTNTPEPVLDISKEIAENDKEPKTEITEMSINKKLFNFRISSGMGRHGTISCFIWVVVFIKSHGFSISF